MCEAAYDIAKLLGEEGHGDHAEDKTAAKQEVPGLVQDDLFNLLECVHPCGVGGAKELEHRRAGGGGCDDV